MQQKKKRPHKLRTLQSGNTRKEGSFHNIVPLIRGNPIILNYLYINTLNEKNKTIFAFLGETFLCLYFARTLGLKLFYFSWLRRCATVLISSASGLNGVASVLIRKVSGLNGVASVLIHEASVLNGVASVLIHKPSVLIRKPSVLISIASV